MQRQFALLHRHPHEGEGHQVLQAEFHRSEFQLAEIFLLARRVLWPDDSGGGRDLAHPFADEVGSVKRRRVGGEGLDAAAKGMAQHHDVADLKGAHREFQRRAGAVLVAGGLAGRRLVSRHDIGDVARHQDFARRGIEYHFRRHPAVTQPISMIEGDWPCPASSW